MPTAGEGMMLFADQMMKVAAEQKAKEVHQEDTALTTQKEVDLANSAHELTIGFKNSKYENMVDPETLEDNGQSAIKQWNDQQKAGIEELRSQKPYLADHFDELRTRTLIHLTQNYADIKNEKLKEFNKSLEIL